MDKNKIESQLKTKKLGREMIILDEIDSTNKEAGRLFALKELRDGHAIIADRQSAGRGRLGREWHSDGCLCMTVALEIDTPTERLGPITLTAGAAVALAIASFTGHEIKIKYPNDIFAKGKKLGGILSELKIDGRQFVLLGIGINVEQETFPGEIAATAISLRQLGIEADRESVAAAILNELETFVELFLDKGFPAVRPFWLEINCTIGQSVVIKQLARTIEGRAINLDDEGNLVVETATGLESVTTGDVLLGTSG